MKKLYKMESKRDSELKESALIRSVKIYAIITLAFLIAVSLREDHNFLIDSLVVLGTFVGVIVIRAIALFSVSYSIENTIIEVDENRISRTGKGLLTNSIWFDEIGEIKKNDVGLVILKEGISSNIGLHTNRTAYSTEPGLIFIPYTIENFDDLEKSIIERIKTSNGLSR